MSQLNISNTKTPTEPNLASLQDGADALSPNTSSILESQHHRCYPKCCGRPVFGGNPEALGWCLDSVGRTLSIIAIGAFLMPAFLTLAYEAAGCEQVDEDCNETVYGIKPSSLLTSVHTIVSVVAAPLMPLMGAIVDHTPHRLRVGRILSTTFLALLFPQIFVSEQTWFALAIVLIILFFVFIFQMTASYSYLPELTEKEQELNQFTRNFTVFTFIVVVLFIATIVGVTGGLGIQTDNVLVARIAISTAFVLAAVNLFFAWGVLFQKRPRLHDLPPGRSVWTAGFYKLYHSCIKIWKDYRALKWFYVAIAFCDGAIESLMTILITFSSDQLGFNSMEIGVSVLIMLVAYVPGAFIASWVTRRFSPIWSTILAVTLIIIITSLSAWLLYGSGQQTLAYILIFFWGMSIGWKWTTDRMLCVAIIPPGQNAEFMGIYLFFGAILTWLPPLIYTSLNEAGVSQRIALASLNVFFLVGLFAYCMMGSYRDAVVAADGVFSRTIATTSITPQTLESSAVTPLPSHDDEPTEGSTTTA